MVVRSPSDGPYAEAKEVLAGFGIIDVASHDRAVELAARFAALVQDPGRAEARDGPRRSRDRAMDPDQPRIEDLLREHAPQVLAAVTRRFGRFDVAEDAVQEALLAAATGGLRTGLPPNLWAG